ncbi:MAG: GNAT family N-acetyltransferase [Alphaproteobacteria bacterium]|nr:GNAT family N-acetyltransferase [Alphaproteobacteria bacterium]
MTDISIRPAKTADLGQLVDLTHQLNLYHKDDFKPSVQKLKQDWNHFECYVAESTQGPLIGFAVGYPTYQFHSATRRYEIQNLYVEKTHQKQGIGRRLMLSVINDQYQNGTECFCLTVNTNNDNARNFYRSLGFREKIRGDSVRTKLYGPALQNFLEKTGF